MPRKTAPKPASSGPASRKKAPAGAARTGKAGESPKPAAPKKPAARKPVTTKTPATRKAASPAKSATSKSPRTCVVVLGMHRSGTSAFTRVLNLLGCAVPRSLMAANANNPAGFWESVKIFHLNTRLLASAGSAWDDWLAFPDSWYRSPPAQSFHAEARELLAEEFGDAPFFALKDPRLCRILPFWKGVLEAQNTRMAALIPLRHPLEVAGSMQRRDGFDPAYGALLWLRHVLDAEFLSRGMARVFVTYDGLLEDWQSVVARTETAFGFTWPGQGDAARGAIASYLSPSLRHHALGEDALARHPSLPVQVGQAYTILKAWAETGEKPADHARLDALRAELNTMGKVFGNIIAAGRAAQEREADLTEERDALSKALEAEKNEHAAATREANDMRHERNLIAQALNTELETVRRLTQDINEARHERNLMAEALEAARTEADEQHAANALISGKLEELRAQHAALEASTAAEREALSRALAEARETTLWMRQALGLTLPSGSGARRLLMSMLPAAWNLRRARARLKQHGVFDGSAYLDANPDLPNRGLDPLTHYVRHGISEGRPAGKPQPRLR